MEIKVYVNYQKGETITEKEYQERIEQEVDERMESKDTFYEWLEGKYTIDEVYEMTPTKKEIVEDEYRDFIKDEVLYEFTYYEWEEVVLEI